MADHDFEKLAQQYWGAWGDAMRAGTVPAQPATPGWNEAIAWWSQLAKGATGVGDHAGVNEALDRFNTQASGWYAQMQQLAAQFVGQNASAADIAGAWKQAMSGHAGNPFADMFNHMQGPGQHDVGQWFEQAKPYLQGMPFEGMEAWQRDGKSWLGMPAFGFAREHQERWQQLAQAQADYQEKNQAYNDLMNEAGQRAFEVFEDKLAERSEPGRQLTSARALFDLWIDAAEEAYAQIALSPRFREVYGELVNSQMRLRGGVQREVEQASGLLGMPTRTEIDSAHRKIVQLERELRRLRDAMQQPVAEQSHRDASPPKPKPAPRKPVGASLLATQSSANALASKLAPTKSVASKRAASKLAKGKR